MVAPGLHRRDLFRLPVVPLIDAGYPRTRTADVVQDSLSHFEPHSEALEPGRERAPKVMKAPRVEFAAAIGRDQLVDLELALRIAGEGRAA